MMLLKVFTQIFLLMTAILAPIDGHWSGESTSSSGHGKLSALDVICGKDHMTVRAEFAGPFHGTISSKGTYGQDNCVYIKPYSGVTHATFNVYYDRCGTKPDLQGKYYENTVVIQYGTDIIEAWDEAKRLRCEWFEAYEKPATFRPAIPVADLDVVEMNFQGDDIDCWMEIQEGKGPWGREVSRIVPVGQPMTIVIAINDYNGQFDMRVKSCFAHDGVKPPIHMTDEYGCVLRPKMLTKFNKVRDPNGKATIISYAHFYAFKFPDSMNVQIQCTVEVCRHGCPDACQKTPFHVPDHQIKQQTSISYGSDQKRIAEDKPERNAIDINRDEENFGVEPQDLQNSGSHLVPGHPVDVPQPPSSPSPSPPLPSPTPMRHSDTSAHQNFDSHRIPTPVYRAANRTSGEEKNEGKRPISEDSNYEVDEKLEQESKLHEKVINMKPDEDSKPVISEKDLANLPTGTLDKAAQLFRDLGMNIDMSNLATGFVNGLNSKNLAQILDNDRIRELAETSGIKLGDHLKSPQVQPFVSSPLIGDESIADAFVSSDDSESVKDGYLEVKDAEENAQKNADASGDKIVDVATASINEYWTPPVSTPSTSPSVGSSSFSSYQSTTSSQSLSAPLSEAKKGQLDSDGSLNDNSSEPVAVSVRRPSQHPQHHLHQPPHPHRSPSSLVPEMAPPMRPPVMAVHTGSDVDHGRHPHQRNKQHVFVNHRNKPIPVENEHLIHPHPQYPIHSLQQAQHLAGNVQNPVAQIVNIPLAPFAIPPTFANMMNGQQQVPPPPPPMPQHFGNRRNPVREQQHYLHPPQAHQPPPHRQPANHYKPSLLASIGNHLPHFNLPSFLGSIQRQDNSPQSPQPASNPNPGQVASGMRQKRPILLTNQINPFPQGPRSLRSRRSSSKEPTVSVKRGFQVVTSIDLSFLPNATDLPEIYSGRKEDIVYGICMPVNGMLVGLTLIFALILFALVSSFCFMRKLRTLRKQHQVS